MYTKMYTVLEIMDQPERPQPEKGLKPLVTSGKL
jgi:hypothetical protein